MSNRATTDTKDVNMDGDHTAAPLDKGKGKAAQDMSMDEDGDSSDEESGVEEEAGEPEGEDEDNMESIDTENIIGRRTRGKNIDFVKAAAEAKDDLEDDEEDEDDDFVAPETEDAMEE